MLMNKPRALKRTGTPNSSKINPRAWKELPAISEKALLASKIRWPELRQRGLTPLVLKAYNVSAQAMLRMGCPKEKVNGAFPNFTSVRQIAGK